MARIQQHAAWFLIFRWRRFKLLSRESATRTSLPFCSTKAISSADERISPAGVACGFTALMVYHVTTSSGKREHETSGSGHDFNTAVSGINRGLSPKCTQNAHHVLSYLNSDFSAGDCFVFTSEEALFGFIAGLSGSPLAIF